MKNIKIDSRYTIQASVRGNKLYCWERRMHVQLCRIDTCEHWQDCYKDLMDMGYELVPDKRKNIPSGLRWELNK